MKFSEESLAWLLAAEDHPHLKNEDGYQAAKQQLETSPELSARFEEAKHFAQMHPILFGFDPMPGDVRDRIARALEAAAPRNASAAPMRQTTARPSAWSTRQQLAWAAVLVLFLGALSVFSSKFIEQRSAYARIRIDPVSPIQLAGASDPLPDFHRFVKHSLTSDSPFQHQARETVQLIQWLEKNEGFSARIPEAITQAPGMGCALLESPHGTVSMICVDIQGQKLKLYIACSKALQVEPRPAVPLNLDGHEALEWSNENHLFLLIQSRPETPMPEMML